MGAPKLAETTVQPGYKDIYEALLAIQGELDVLHKDGANPHFKSRYVTLPGLLRVVRPVLTAHGVLLTHKPMPADGAALEVCTSLRHVESATEETACMVVPVTKNDAQGRASAYSYGKRYTLMGLLGLEGDDDDGEAAVGRNGSSKSATAQKQPPLEQRIPKALSHFKSKGLADPRPSLEEYLNKGMDEWTHSEMDQLIREQETILEAFVNF